MYVDPSFYNIYRINSKFNNVSKIMNIDNYNIIFKLYNL